jgi:GTP-binding protein
VVGGTVRSGDLVKVLGDNAESRGNIKKLYVFEGLKRVAVEAAAAGEVVAIAGLDEVAIGDTITGPEDIEALPRIVVEEPTIKMRVGVNTGSFAENQGRGISPAGT